MKHLLRELLTRAVKSLWADEPALAQELSEIQIERTRDAKFGDFSSNIALGLAKKLKMNPRQLAAQIAQAIASSPLVERVETAGAGFINFYLQPTAYQDNVRSVLEENSAYGKSRLGKGQQVQVEFVSANPTGPLHIGHGRGAAYGATIANLLSAVGFQVQREYYVNDAGRQMDILAVSVWLRYLETQGESFTFPANAYRGGYVKDIAQKLFERDGNKYRIAIAPILTELSAVEDLDDFIDQLIEQAKSLLGNENFKVVHDFGLNLVLDGIRIDLADFGVTYDNWFSEYSLTEDAAVQRTLDKLIALGSTYQQEGAVWFKSTRYGDEKDRVVIRENGNTTYFTSDIAYHLNKYERGFEHMINIWGADHHGYVPRVKAALQALGEDPHKLEVLLVQFATLFRGTERVQMSTRSGEFITLRELFEEVGKDAARFFYVMRRSEQHLEFDLELAKSQSNDNPVYYIQYAHARVASVFRQLNERGLLWDEDSGKQHLDQLTSAHELDLMNMLSRFPEVIESAALQREPHQLTHYLRELSQSFHAYYNAQQFIVETEPIRNARLSLIRATQIVIKNGLSLLDVSAPESM